MKWLEVNIETLSSPDGLPVELVIGALMETGITGVQTLDDYEMKLFLENNPDFWDYADEELLNAVQGKALVRFYVEDEFAAETLITVRQGLERLKTGEFGDNLGSLELSAKSVDDADWADNWKKYYKPFRVGEKLVIRPEWEDFASGAGDVVLSLNPGQVFGTGLHQTTRMCLEALENLDCAGAKVLDLGCGSGILSIAALLLGAETAAAVDIDRSAHRVVAENAEMNGIRGGKLRIFTGNVLNDSALADGLGSGFDIVLANIIADIVIEMTPLVKKKLAAGGRFISSGIISQRLEDVLCCLEENGFRVIEITRRDEWAAVISAL
ncbi:MAG: 50S ribosomal protein L11 methyltransferase [Defluviitaleaceae bacterium]|nr:50S ribosomal protein L11 methyltransferase [Defluviitaleaceae bacterium]MCL2837362.1 50S ribosomal protein L11 methyltransferase [Defluviitaleaceae bacterium]